MRINPESAMVIQSLQIIHIALFKSWFCMISRHLPLGGIVVVKPTKSG